MKNKDLEIRNQQQMACINYDDACDHIRDKFIEKYFAGTMPEYYWIEEKMKMANYNLSINDYFFNLHDMYLALRENVRPKWLFEFYEWSTNDISAIGDMHHRNLNYFLNLKKLKQI